MSSTQLYALFLWAVVLEVHRVAERCREAIAGTIDVSTVALVLAAGHATNDSELLRHCYWCLREAICGSNGPPAAWLDGKGPVRLARGYIAYREVCRTPLCVMTGVP